MRTLLVGLAVVAVAIGGLVAALSLGEAGEAGGAGGREGPAEGVASDAVTEGTPRFGLTDAVAELPPATLEGLAGGEDVAVADLLGAEPLVLNFWATWCDPCVREMPDLQRLAEAGRGQIQLVGVNVFDSPVLAEEFLDELGVTYPQVADPDRAYFRATGGFGMPTTLLVHPDGRVAYRHTGPLTLAEMGQLVAEHLDVRLPGV